MFIGTTACTPGGTVEVAVVVDGQEQPLYRRSEDSKIFVAGTPGQAYGLCVTNVTGWRVETIVTVDGRNTLDGELANRGLVIDGLDRYKFTGWRTSDQTHEFIFELPKRSVAAPDTGPTKSVGVIEIAVHLEREYDYKQGGFELIDSFMPGEEAYGSFGHTYFSRSVAAPDVLTIQYGAEDALRQQGIIGPTDPDPFPGNS